jgi:hypothetical protein
MEKIKTGTEAFKDAIQDMSYTELLAWQIQYQARLNLIREELKKHEERKANARSG